MIHRRRLQRRAAIYVGIGFVVFLLFKLLWPDASDWVSGFTQSQMRSPCFDRLTIFHDKVTVNSKSRFSSILPRRHINHISDLKPILVNMADQIHINLSIYGFSLSVTKHELWATIFKQYLEKSRSNLVLMQCCYSHKIPPKH